MKTFVIGDIHGAYRALMQVFEKSGFDYNKDRLICLGDVADGWSQVPECFDELLKIKNLVYIMGNHDKWLLGWLEAGTAEYIWLSQGGNATLAAYTERGEDISVKMHKKLLSSAAYYYIDENNNLFVHGGFDWHKDIKEQRPYDLMWDRQMFGIAMYWQQQADKKKMKEVLRFKKYNEIFIGHTATSGVDRLLRPVHASNLWNLDQGAGWKGVLTIMNVDTKEYWQSDIVKTLYPDEMGR